MATLTAQKATQAGTTYTEVAASGGGDQYLNSGKEMFLVINGDVASKTVTFNSQVACNQGSDHDIAVTVGAGVSKLIGPFEVARFNDTNGYVQVTYSAVTSVTVAVIST